LTPEKSSQWRPAQTLVSNQFAFSKLFPTFAPRFHETSVKVLKKCGLKRPQWGRQIHPLWYPFFDRIRVGGDQGISGGPLAKPRKGFPSFLSVR